MTENQFLNGLHLQPHIPLYGHAVRDFIRCWWRRSYRNSCFGLHQMSGVRENGKRIVFLYSRFDCKCMSLSARRTERALPSSHPNPHVLHKITTIALLLRIRRFLLIEKTLQIIAGARSLSLSDMCTLYFMPDSCTKPNHMNAHDADDLNEWCVIFAANASSWVRGF